MWERKDAEKDRFEPQPVRNEPHRTAAAPTFQPKVAHANLGQSLFIKGEVSGSEDLTVEGRVEGRIDLKDHNLTIGPNGRVHAEIHAKNITIVGEVTGNVVADERVDLTDTGRLIGDIRAPRISVSDGAQFKGSVDMVQIRGEQAEKGHSREKNVAAGGQHQAVQVAQAAQAGKGLQ
ncbi:MAG TPA: polymer-forming cytoskeletal protein [Candidatus Polarisedimenticolia bacterium]|nr:polymer-forming cytoskeletal protein [Candidatus Polarisedimenticolia bacterium]